MRRRLRRPLNAWQDVPYLTFRNTVYLGRVRHDVRRRAKEAGLIVVTAKTMLRYRNSVQTIQRMIDEGRWYDTVKYP